MTTVANKITRETWYGAYSYYRKHKKLFEALKETPFEEDDAAYNKTKREFDDAHSRWLDYAVDAIKKDTGLERGLGLVIDEICRYAHTKPIDLTEFSAEEILRARLRERLPKVGYDFFEDSDEFESSNECNYIVSDDFFAPLQAQTELEIAHATFFTPRITECRNAINDYERQDKALLTLGLSLSQIVWLHVTSNIQYGLFAQSRSDVPARQLP